jgi:hypothetical protein
MVKDKNRRKILMEEQTIAYMTLPTNIYLIIYMKKLRVSDCRGDLHVEAALALHILHN